MSGELRLFWAVNFPAEIKAGLAELQEGLKKAGADVKWVEPQNFHLTVQFLGAVAPGRVEVITGAVRRAAVTLKSFELCLGGLGAFPNINHPRVIWVPAGGDLAPMFQLQRQVEAVLKPLGFTPDKGSYTPHVTLGRVRSTRGLAGLAGLLGKNAHLQWASGTFTVNSVDLMESRLSRLGPTYSVVGEIPLARP